MKVTGGPLGPGAPVAPTSPVGPMLPGVPAAPVGPVGPVTPALPAGPVTPAEPAAPVAPVGPVGPVGPAGKFISLEPSPTKLVYRFIKTFTEYWWGMILCQRGWKVEACRSCVDAGTASASGEHEFLPRVPDARGRTGADSSAVSGWSQSF